MLNLEEPTHPAGALARVYRLLARLFHSEIDRSLLQSLIRGETFSPDDGFDLSSSLIAPPRDDKETLAALSKDFQRLFVGAHDCHPICKDLVLSAPPHWRAIFQQAMGLIPAHQARDPLLSSPDHISAFFLLMAQLSEIETGNPAHHPARQPADQPASQPADPQSYCHEDILAAQRACLIAQSGRRLPELFLCLERQARENFYQQLALSANSFIRNEAARLGIKLTRKRISRPCRS